MDLRAASDQHAGVRNGPDARGILRGGGECAALIRSIDWSRTPVGAIEDWPSTLTTTLGIMLHSRHPMFLWWGPELIQFYNDAYVPSFGKGKHPAAMGQRGEECWPEIWSIISPQIRDVMERGIPSWNENQLVPIFRDGGIQEVYWTYGYSPVFDEAQRIAGTLVVCQETTNAVLEKQAVERANTEAVAAQERLQQQSDFEKHLLGIVSHDLRTPLNVISLGAGVLADQPNLPAASAKVLLRMQSATRRGIRMIDDLMDFTQARLGGGLRIHPRSTNLREIVDQVVQELEVTHPAQSFKVEHDGHALGSWDPDRIAQALINLLTNALTYGSASEPITVRVRTEDACFLLQVHNQGPPIPADIIPKLFEPMQRGTKSSTERSVGLGLYIVNEIAKGHGGSVGVESSQSAGTTFSIRLPRTEASSEA